MQTQLTLQWYGDGKIGANRSRIEEVCRLAAAFTRYLPSTV